MMPVKIPSAPNETTADGGCIAPAKHPHKVAAAMARILIRPLRNHCDIGLSPPNSAYHAHHMWCSTMAHFGPSGGPATAFFFRRSHLAWSTPTGYSTGAALRA